MFANHPEGKGHKTFNFEIQGELSNASSKRCWVSERNKNIARSRREEYRALASSKLLERGRTGEMACKKGMGSYICGEDEESNRLQCC